jgi:hypothetical protein
MFTTVRLVGGAPRTPWIIQEEKGGTVAALAHRSYRVTVNTSEIDRHKELRYQKGKIVFTFAGN